MDIEALITNLGLEPLEGEGGLWAPIYRDSSSNAIYFAMISPDFSAWHRIKEPELWVLIDGSPIELSTIESGKLKNQILDRSTARFSYRVPATTWMAARPMGAWSLLVCSLTPPFSGMELAKRAELAELFPNLNNLPELFHD